MTRDEQLELLKQAGLASYLLGQLAHQPGRLLRGTGEMLKDFGASRAPGNWLSRTGEALGKPGGWLENVAQKGENYATDLAAQKGFGGYAKRFGLGTARIGATWSPLMIPGVAAYAMPVWSTAQNAGNMAGTALGLSGGRGQQYATEGAQTGFSQLYNTISQLPYDKRREFLNNPQHMQGMINNNAPGAMSFVPGAPPEQTGLWNGIKQVMPTGYGDLSPWVRQQARQSMKQGRSLMKQSSNWKTSIMEGLARGAAKYTPWLRPLGENIAAHTVGSSNLPIKWMSKATAAAAPTVGMAGLLGGTLGYLHAPAVARQVGVDAGMAGTQQSLANMPSWQRELAAIDPTVLMSGANQRMPGTSQVYSQITGQPYQSGIFGGLADKFMRPSVVTTQGGYGYG